LLRHESNSYIRAITQHWKFTIAALVSAPFFYALFFVYGVVSLFLAALLPVTINSIFGQNEIIVTGVCAGFFLVSFPALCGYFYSLTFFTLLKLKFNFTETQKKLFWNIITRGIIYGLFILFWGGSAALAFTNGESLYLRFSVFFIVICGSCTVFCFLFRKALKKSHTDLWPQIQMPHNAIPSEENH
jgi:hypothetical protein